VDELLTYWRLGIDEFILSGFPHVEECVRVSQEVLPRLRAAIAQAEPSAAHAKK
jgi:alkanesulfonate monooxygenase